jgi:hypothetical protein
MLFTTKYKPNTQKSLFHKDIVAHIRKWIVKIEDLFEFNKSLKQILFIYGPMGCGKSATIECLFKGYNLIKIDSDSIKSVEKFDYLLNLIINFNDITLINIDKLNHKNKVDKKNIVLIDNVELCDKNLENFINLVYNKYNRNIPIVLISNNKKYSDIFINYSNCTNLEFKKPSLLELTKLACEINKQESLNLTKENIKLLITKSYYDIRQLLFVLEQWSYSNMLDQNSNMLDQNSNMLDQNSNMLDQNSNMLDQNIYIGDDIGAFHNFITSLELKDHDLDLFEKLTILFDNSDYNSNNLNTMCSSEPYTISNSIYQNYINTCSNLKSKLSQKDNLQLLNNFANIMDNISFSNIIQVDIFENQNFNLYNEYIYSSCVIPCYYLKSNTNLLLNQNESKDVFFNNLQSQFSSFKDICYNFIKSYEEVKKLCKIHKYNKYYQSNFNLTETTISNFECCFLMVKNIIKCIKILNEYFDTNKKGKNTTKKEKFLLYNNINTEPVKKALEIIVNNIYFYHFFEIDIDQFIVNKSKYINSDKSINENFIKENITQIDLKIFKRFLNIFTFDDSNKLFKANIEISIQYELFKRIINEFNVTSNNVKTETEIDNLTTNLNEIWDF